ncbi:hypothetical protein EVAR_93951_1 [Eumeta japonica]|uniref:Uncharacterized protein n=1 Tax=Eumeta variegata TaxID=151549 RepID=A0A4C1TP76_EUMVA|nr:hypothetical protein EVAR_93951_1 [Eumeta japonica]
MRARAPSPRAGRPAFARALKAGCTRCGPPPPPLASYATAVSRSPLSHFAPQSPTAVINTLPVLKYFKGLTGKLVLKAQRTTTFFVWMSATQLLARYRPRQKGLEQCAEVATIRVARVNL